MEKTLTEKELLEIQSVIEDYTKIYNQAARIGKQIEDLQSEMVKVSAEMTNKSSDEGNLYRKIAERLDLTIEEARSLVLEELQKNMVKK